MAETRRTLDAFNNASTGLFKDNSTADISAQDLRDFAYSVSPVLGAFYFSTAAATTPAGAGTDLKALGTTAAVKQRDMTHTTNRLTYDASMPDIGALAVCTGVVTAGGSKSVSLLLVKNGNLASSLATSSKVTIDVTTSDHAFALSGYDTLSAGDYVELWLANEDDTTTVTIQQANVQVQGQFI